MAKFTRSRRRYGTGKRPAWKGGKKSPYSKKSKVNKYSRSNKQRYINKSNPVEENKKVEGTEISRDVGRNALGNPILMDFSENPSYLNNEPNLDEDLPIANLPTGRS